MRRDVGDNRNTDSSFTKKAKEWGVRYNSDYQHEEKYMGFVTFSLVYVYEKSADTISSNWEQDDHASKRFKTEKEARAWVDKKLEEFGGIE